MLKEKIYPINELEQAVVAMDNSFIVKLIAEGAELTRPDILAAKEAFEDGFSAGEERGISLGAQQAKLETAKSMKQENMSVSLIARFTGLSPDEIEKL